MTPSSLTIRIVVHAAALQPAEFYETHLLRLRIGAKKPGLYRQSFRINQPYRLRIRICQTCYQADFVTDVENLEHDQTSSGRLARIYARLYTLGAIIACAGAMWPTARAYRHLTAPHPITHTAPTCWA